MLFSNRCSRGHSTVPGLVYEVAHNVRLCGDFSVDYSRHLHAWLADWKLGLKTFILNRIDSRHSVFHPTLINHPCLHVCSAIPAHITYTTAVALIFNYKVRSSGGETLPTTLVSAIALYQVVLTKSCRPANVTAIQAARPELCYDRDLPVL